ncbi:hypothetical protein CMUS01_12291 [Colletotrichum musicola]|uniref:Uncharacterized protein n=1 Tax=Colletotrichum musicola TaxID=2175873 RepID=A0A8H6N1N9_9PEZI|nr:hypothetical protein CMUS01_12291 [Colletotrichum musicola]
MLLGALACSVASPRGAVGFSRRQMSVEGQICVSQHRPQGATKAAGRETATHAQPTTPAARLDQNQLCPSARCALLKERLFRPAVASAKTGQPGREIDAISSLLHDTLDKLIAIIWFRNSWPSTSGDWRHLVIWTLDCRRLTCFCCCKMESPIKNTKIHLPSRPTGTEGSTPYCPSVHRMQGRVLAVGLRTVLACQWATLPQTLPIDGRRLSGPLLVAPHRPMAHGPWTSHQGTAVPLPGEGNRGRQTGPIPGSSPEPTDSSLFSWLLTSTGRTGSMAHGPRGLVGRTKARYGPRTRSHPSLVRVGPAAAGLLDVQDDKIPSQDPTLDARHLVELGHQRAPALDVPSPSSKVSRVESSCAESRPPSTGRDTVGGRLCNLHYKLAILPSGTFRGVLAAAAANLTLQRHSKFDTSSSQALSVLRCRRGETIARESRFEALPMSERQSAWVVGDAQGPDSLAKTLGSTFLPKGCQCDETSPLKSLGHLLAQSPDPDSPTAQRKFTGWTPTERRPSEASKGRLAAATAEESGPSNPRTLQDAGAEAQCSSVWDARDEIGETSSRRGASEDLVLESTKTVRKRRDTPRENTRTIPRDGERGVRMRLLQTPGSIHPSRQGFQQVIAPYCRRTLESGEQQDVDRQRHRPGPPKSSREARAASVARQGKEGRLGWWK